MKLLWRFFVKPAEEALAHPYLSSLHDVTDEPVCPTVFNYNVEEEQSLLEENIRALVYEEACKHMRRQYQSHIQ
jgi:hypothetical protein